jgi:hypothetical protein
MRPAAMSLILSRFLKTIYIFGWVCFNGTLGIVAAMADDVAVSIAEVVWVERMGEMNHIRHAKFDVRQWHQTSASLYSSNAPLTNPTINTKSNGDRLLIWVEQIKNRTVLKQMTGRYSQINNQPNFDRKRHNRIWSDATILSDFRLENFAPSVAVDGKQRFWVVWASSNSTQSDIFMIRQLGNNWTLPAQVNSDNLTPDMRPIVNTDIAGNIYVEWTGYDQSIQGLTENLALFSQDGDRLETNLFEHAKLLEYHNYLEHSLLSITDPGFLPKQSRILIHFPQNTLIQSVSR